MAREHGVADAAVDAIGRGEDPGFAADDAALASSTPAQRRELAG